MNSNYLEVFKMVHKKYEKEDLNLLKDNLDKLSDKQKELLDLFLEKSGISLKNLYFDENGLPNFYYYNPPYYLGITSLHADDANNSLIDYELDKLKLIVTEVDKALEESKYSKYFYLIEGPCDLLLFEHLFEELDGQNKYDILTELYVSFEYGHNQISRKMWEEAIRGRKHRKAKEIPFKGEELTIYRGNSSESTDISKAMSWSLKPRVAAKFVGRDFSSAGVIYKAHINREDVIDYFDNRDEAEVICFPEDLKGIVKFQQIEPLDFYQELEKERIIDEFVYYRNTVLPKIEGYNEGVHSNMHTVRVLLLTLSLAYLLDVSDRDRFILANAALYHDSARTDDSKDPKHGERAAEKIKKENIDLLTIQCKDVSEEYELGYLNKNEKSILRDVIKYHSLDDTLAMKDIKEKRTFKLLEILKDADALDRVRFKGVNLKYLRNDISKELIGFSHLVFNAIK